MTVMITRQRSGMHSAHGGFGRLLHAEWTKFRTVRGWPIAMIIAAVVTILVGLWAASGPKNSCGPATTGAAGGGPAACRPRIPVGPDGTAVTDSFYFVHQPLAGDGSISAEVTSLTGRYSPNGAIPAGPDPAAGMHPGIQPWAKAGIIIKASTRQGSQYAAMMVTGRHGARFQYDYAHDAAGLPGKITAVAPRWLRLIRSGDVLTGYDSADGRQWTRVGSIRLPRLPRAAQAGLFVASPQHVTSQSSGPSVATAVFGHVSLPGARPGGAWHGSQIGTGSTYPTLPGQARRVGGVFTIRGSGDIAPAAPGPVALGKPLEYGLLSVFAGLIVVLVVGAMFITAEYRRGMIRTTLAAVPRRGRVLAAKAVVTGSVTFAAGLVGAAVTIPLGERLLRGNGNYVFPATALTELRVVAGTAALLAVSAVLALALGAILRHGAATVTAVIGLIVLPYFFAVPLAVLPPGAADWLLRVTPAAGFAIQQSNPAYSQVSNVYTPQYGYYPLAPWAGFAVLCAWAAAALALAYATLRRTDA